MAIAHDYLTQRGGAERVVLAMLRAFPEATVHTLLYDPDGTFPEFRDVAGGHLAARTGSARCAATTASRCRCWPRPRPG